MLTPAHSNIAFIDFETTGADSKKDRPTEVAVIVTDRLYHVKHQLSHFLWEEGYPELTEQIEMLTNIKQTDLIMYGKNPRVIMQELLNVIRDHGITHMVAHNAEFDRNIFESECRRQGLLVPELEWVCTIKDVPYEEKYRCKILSHLALDHGISVDPTSLHRAIADVELLVRLMNEGTYYFEDILEHKHDVWVYLQALIPPPWEDGGAGKDAARAEGYSYQKDMRWGEDGPTFAKQWVKRVKSKALEAEKAKTVPFKRQIIKE